MDLKHPILFGAAKPIIEHYLATHSPSKVFFFCDTNTEIHCYPLLQEIPHQALFTMKAGELHKSLTTCEQVWNQLIEANADRDSLLICLGGGVVTDLGGFVASCYKRGIKFLHVPTSLLAMVDASTGGKTGFNLGKIKNSIGAFRVPEAVIIDDQFLTSLPERHIKNGVAEILKHGFIRKKEHIQNLETAEKTKNWLPVIQESIEIKKSVVEDDPFEKGERKILNFGHTIGHAIESYSLSNDEAPLLHGEAIALGMLAEAYLSKKYCDLPIGDFKTIESEILHRFQTKSYTDLAHEKMVKLMKNDKKNEEDEIRMSLLTANGKATYNINVSEEDCYFALKQINV